MEIVRCNLCGENSSNLYLSTYDRFSGEKFELSQCRNCGLIYLNPRPTSDELSKYYPDEYEAYTDINQIIRGTKDQARGNTIAMHLNYIEQFCPTRGNVLDIGCATGNFLHLAQKRGWQVVGIEIMEKAAKIARQQYHLNVITTDLQNSSLQDSTFNVITLWDVLEHLPDPIDSMKIVHHLLKPEGMVFFSIPNLNSYDRKIFGSNWIGWDPPRHFSLFDQVNIHKLLDMTGFKIISQRCLSGGKGTFLLSLDKYLNKKSSLYWIKNFYSAISLLLWPYRRFSYLTMHGPILYYAAVRA